MRRLWSVLVATLALCLVLVGCGGKESSSGEAAPQKPTSTSEATTETDAQTDLGAAFKGSWELVSMVQEGEETSEEDMEAIKSFGLYVYLDLNDDGSAALDTFGEVTTGTWEAKEQDSATVSMGGDPAKVTLSDGRLTMTQGDSSLTFKQIDPSEKIDQSSESSGAQYYGGDTIADLDDAIEMNVGLVDDSFCTVEVVAKGVYAGDPGFLFTLTNKTDQDILFMSTGMWTAANGIEDDPVLYETLHAGETLQSIMWFHADTIGTADPSALTDVKGTIVLLDAADTSSEIARYDVTF